MLLFEITFFIKEQACPVTKLRIVEGGDEQEQHLNSIKKFSCQFDYK